MEYTASKTAIGAGMLRIAHQLIDGNDKLLNDPVILTLLGEKAVQYVLENENEFSNPESGSLRTHVVLRSRYAEDRLKAAYDAGVRQFIILGAGLDTFAYRQPDWASELTIVEADHPASQAYKLEILRNKGIGIPGNVTYLNIDLEKDDLKKVFGTSAIDLTKPVFIACLGVLIYLNAKTVEKIFYFASQLPTGSEFVFTASFNNSGSATSYAAQRAADAGEPWITYFDQISLKNQLADLGFNFNVLTPEMAYKLYYEGKSLQIPVPKSSSIVRISL